MSPHIRATTRLACPLMIAGLLGLSSLPAAAATSVAELADLSERAWQGQTELLPQAYAPDAVHTATFYDATTEHVGIEAIEPLAALGWIERIGPIVDLSTSEDAWRWVTFASLGGGSTCMFRASDGLIEHHDCLVPEMSGGSVPRAGTTDDPDTLAAIEEVAARLQEAWGPASSVELLSEVYAPDGVHSARFVNVTRTYTGPEEIASVSSLPGAPEPIGPVVAFETPDGELAWAQANDIAGGSVCSFHAVDGMVTRHDCYVPVRG